MSLMITNPRFSTVISQAGNDITYTASTGTASDTITVNSGTICGSATGTTSVTITFDTHFWLSPEEREHRRITKELDELINEESPND